MLVTTKAPLAIVVAKERLRVLGDYQPIAAQVFVQGDIMKDVQLRVGLFAALNTNGNNFGAGGELKWRF